MAVSLSDELKAAVDARPGEPVPVVDDRTNREYVLVPVERYELLEACVESDYEKDRAEWQAAGLAAFWRAGWNDPSMDVYDNYDENLGKLRGEPG